MKLVASLVVRNEAERYLRPCLEHLAGFCDEIRVLDDASTDATRAVLAELTPLVRVKPNPTATFYSHEGATRQLLLDWTLEAKPTHVLAIDADEFIGDPRRLREAMHENLRSGVWSLRMEEVWKATATHLMVRADGGWRPHPVPILWRVDRGRSYRIRNVALACGREPDQVRRHHHRARETGVSIFHFGWTREEERQARFDRYAEHDAGRFHANAHLQSILWPDSRIKMQRRPWPPSLSYEKVLG